MSYILMTETRPIARVKHLCTYCGECVEVSERYYRAKYMCEGYWQNEAWHIECIEHGKVVISKYKNERPAERLGFKHLTK